MPRPESIAPQALPSAETLRGWVAAARGLRATVYLPLQWSVPAVKQNAILLADASREVEARLGAAGLSAETAGAWAARLRAVKLGPNGGAGPAALALLLDEQALQAVAMHVATPYRVTVASAFALRPLLAAMRRASRYRVLTVSANRVALFEGGPEGLAPAPQPGLPESLEDALGAEKSGNELRVRGSRAGGGSPIFYSHGAARDERKLDLERFHQALGRVLAGHLGDGSLPLVLIATEEHQSGLRAAAKMPALLADGVVCNPDRLSPAELHAAAWPLVERWLGDPARDGSSWERARNRGKGLDLLDDIGAAAVSGRVRRLWVDAEQGVPGRLDAAGRVVAGSAADDALDGLVEAVLARGGEVIPMPAASLPSKTGAAAELH